MTEQSVLSRFASLAELSMQEAGSWTSLIEDACAQIRARTHGLEETEETDDLLEAAAAALAFYEYKTIESSKSGVTSFKAGDVSVELGGSSAGEAYRMYQSLLEACTKLPKDGDFVFGRMDQLCTEN